MQDTLVELGLSKNEAVIYLFLLKNGTTTTGPIIKNTRITNSRVYASLNSLIAKGLVTYTIRKNGKNFQAAGPRKILEMEEERKKQIESILPNLIKMQRHKRTETETAIYEEFNGFKAAFNKIVDDCPKNGTIMILGFSEPAFAKESLSTFITNVNLKSAKKKQRLKIILDNSLRNSLGKVREKEKFSEVRYMPEGYISPAAIDIFEDFVYLFLWEEKPFVFMIKNKKITESFKQYFKFLWKIAKK